MGRRHAHQTTQSSATPPPAPLSFREKMVAGAIARCVAQTFLHPVDVIRTRLQARDVAASWSPSVFIKGVFPQILLAIPAGATQFLAFEAAKDRLSQLLPDENLSQTRLLLAGAAGALAAATFRVPQEVLKQRIQADIYPNFFVALRETLGKQGITSLYKGSLVTISRDVPWNALSFMFHGQAKRIFEGVEGRMPRNDENLALAGVAGALAAVIMTPVDVVKTRIMTQRAGVGVQYGGLISTLKRIIAEEGAPTLMKGVVPRVLFLAPLAGITFSVYEAVVKNMRKKKVSQQAQNGKLLSHHVSTEKSFKAGRFTFRFAKRAVRIATRNDAPFEKEARLVDLGSIAPIWFSLPA